MKSEHKVIPIFRIFDYQKTIEFYVDWLGFMLSHFQFFWESPELCLPLVRLQNRTVSCPSVQAK